MKPALLLIAGSLMAAVPTIDFFSPSAVRHKSEVPLVLEPLRGTWDFSFFTDISATVRNPADVAITLSLAVEDESSSAITASVEVGARATAVLAMPLSRPVGHLADGSQLILIGMRSFPWATSRKPARPKIDPRKVARVSLAGMSVKGPVRIEMNALQLVGSTEIKPAPGKPLFPLFDEYGQYIHWEWPGKVHTVEDMRRSLEQETADLARHARPQDWDEYGGWAAGPSLRATGAFRTEKYQGKWWLVDPQGKLFFSYGPACVQLKGDPTIVDRRRNYFAWLPEETDPRYKDFFSAADVREDFDFGTGSIRSFSFLQANLLRKFGGNWREESAELAHRRVASWAMNSMGNWSDLEVCRMDRFYPKRHGRTAYTVPVRFRGAPLMRGRGGAFYDPFHPAFAEALRGGMKELAELTADDPWCIGYFVQNEVPWNGSIIFRLSLESPAEQPTKQAMVRFLQAKYTSIDRLNAAWKTGLASWDALRNSRHFEPAEFPAKDVDEFYRAFMEQYFRTVRGVVRGVAPKHLYLGCRFHSWSRMRIPAIAAAKYADVVSVNYYATPKEMADFTYPDGLDVPVVISEWHFGARDRGQFDCGMRAVANQSERAQAFRGFMQAALDHPLVVGAHWFRYHDHPSGGRAGGDSRSNSQNGLLDPTDSPYMETIEAARAVGHTLYQTRAGKR